MHLNMERDRTVDRSDGGKPSKFTRWFGRSKIVDEDGAPRIVYHGTTVDFDSFRTKKRNPALGFHFGSVSQAEWFAGYDERSRTSRGSRILPCFLRIENPLRMPDVFNRGLDGAIEVAYWLFREGAIQKIVYARVCRAKSAREADDRVVIAIEALGYDGIVYENVHEGGTWNTNEDSYIGFQAQQIKSVFNRGTFDPMSENILE